VRTATCGRRTEIAFSTAIRVYFQDTDAGEVVYHGAYLNFFERARTEWLRHLGFEQPDLQSRFGVMFIVRSVDMRFVRPARLDDLLDVTVDVLRPGRAQVTLAQEVRRDRETLVRAAVNLACVTSGNFRPHALPDELGSAFFGAADTRTTEGNVLR
jgi:acyl-CoA thioester hydrolase